MERQDKEKPSGYFVFTEYELLTLAVCIILDVVEYVFAALLLPVFGDFLDIVGIVACFIMFRLIGIISLFELVPGADVLPIFMITWLIWYLVRKRRELI
ncbi:MAG: hypothetical protein WCC63_05530 [Candidatus Bathyarchaeia archaeon]